MNTIMEALRELNAEKKTIKTTKNLKEAFFFSDNLKDTDKKVIQREVIKANPDKDYGIELKTFEDFLKVKSPHDARFCNGAAPEGRRVFDSFRKSGKLYFKDGIITYIDNADNSVVSYDDRDKEAVVEDICPECGNKKSDCICEKETCNEDETIEIIDDKEEELKESKSDSSDIIHDACLELDIDYDTIGASEDGYEYVIGKEYTEKNLTDIIDYCKNKNKKATGHLRKLAKDNDSMIFYLNDKEELKESDKPAATSIEDAQKWVDYDMEKYGRISGRTNRLVRKAGFQIVKDDHGEYEVIAGKYEALNEDDNDNQTSSDDSLENQFKEIQVDLQDSNSYKDFVDTLNNIMQNPDQLKIFKDGLSKIDTTKANVQEGTIKVTDLTPTQSEIDLNNSMAWILNGGGSKDSPNSSNVITTVNNVFGSDPAKPGKPGSKVITFNKKYIIDGHHRWSQAYCADKDNKIEVINFEFPGDAIDALKRFQVAIAATSTEGKLPSSSAGKGTNLISMNKDSIKSYIADNISKVAVDEIIKKKPDLKDEASVIEYLTNNAYALSQNNKPISGAPERFLMPQTNPDAIEKAKQAMTDFTSKSDNSSSEDVANESLKQIFGFKPVSKKSAKKKVESFLKYNSDGTVTDTVTGQIQGKDGIWRFPSDINKSNKEYSDPNVRDYGYNGNLPYSHMANMDTRMRENIEEDFESSKPVEILPKDEVIEFIRNVKPGTFFKLGVMRELNSEIASKFRGGRGSEETLPIRIIKCSESYVATGEDYENQKETIARREQGIERSTRRTGFNMSEDPDLKNKIFISDKGESLAYYPRRGSLPKVKYFLSIDNGDLEEVSKQDIIPYLTPAQAAKLSGSQERDDADSAPVANALKVNLDKIYYIGNLGHSIM